MAESQIVGTSTSWEINHASHKPTQIPFIVPAMGFDQLPTKANSRCLSSNMGYIFHLILGFLSLKNEVLRISWQIKAQWDNS